MAITYRIGHDGRLSVQEMDGNFQYIEDELGTLSSTIQSLDLAGLTASVLALEAEVVNIELSATGLSASVDTLISDVAGLTASVIDLQNAFSSITGDFNLLLLVGGVTQSGTFSFANGILATYSLV